MKTIYYALGASLLLFSGCQKKDGPCCSSSHISQELKINLLTEPQTLNPTRARALADINIIRMFSEGLTRIDSNGTPSPAIAEKIDVSEDQKTYTFRLRDAKWSNGEPVTSHDFIYAWKQSLAPDYPSDNAFFLYRIKNAMQIKKGLIPASLLGVSAPDDKTLVVTLNTPVPFFLELLAHPIYFPVPRNVVSTTSSWAENADTYVGCGPFSIEEWNHHGSITARKNPHYWDAKNVTLSTISLAMVTEETGLKMFEMNELDWEGSPFSTLPTDALPTLKDQELLKTAPFCATCWMRINTNLSPLNSPLIRKALALAINREEILQHITHGTQIPATAIVPPTFNLQEEPLFADANIELAKELFAKGMKESGLKVKKLPEITLMYAMGDRNHKIAQAIQHQWQEALGIDIQLKQVEAKVAFSHISHGDYQIAIGNWFADVNDAVNFLEVFKSKDNGTNNTGWESEEYAALIDQSFETIDLEERRQLLAKSEQLIMNEMPVIPIFNFTMCYVQDDHVKDVALTAMGSIDFKWARIDE